MIIIDQNTDTTLHATLDMIRLQEQNAHCIYFKLKDQPIETALKEKLVASVSKHIPSVDAQIFFCEDGDIFIIEPSIDKKHGHEFMVDIAAQLNRPANRDWISFIELPLHVHPLMAQIEAKLEIRRKTEADIKKQAEQLELQRKRQAILSGGGAQKRQDIKNKRAERKTPELMIIEDDAFSRRLVESVLQKKFPLTGLGEATDALDTYARVAPDLLFLDINLPDVTGHELLERIMTIDPDAYVIMLSGNTDKDNIMQAMSKGAKGFVAKPFTKDKLFQYIERCPTISH